MRVRIDAEKASHQRGMGGDGLIASLIVRGRAERQEDMAIASINGVRLFYELIGSGEIPLVLVHGSWDSHHDWDLLVPRLAKSCRVLTYDRRGHSQSARLPGQGSVREDVADLPGVFDLLGDLEPS